MEIQKNIFLKNDESENIATIMDTKKLLFPQNR